MKRGVPPTARNARTGEFTPPGMLRWARWNSESERVIDAWTGTGSGIVAVWAAASGEMRRIGRGCRTHVARAEHPFDRRDAVRSRVDQLGHAVGRDAADRANRQRHARTHGSQEIQRRFGRVRLGAGWIEAADRDVRRAGLERCQRTIERIRAGDADDAVLAADASGLDQRRIGSSEMNAV